MSEPTSQPTDDDRRREKFGLSPAEKSDAQNQPGAFPDGSAERDEARAGSQAHQDEMDKQNAAKYQDMKAEELRNEVAFRNPRREQQGLEPLPQSGSKADLVARLVEDDRTDPAGA
jgi:phosphoglycolate phosphatase-like HAD superfamily hydrolase